MKKLLLALCLITSMASSADVILLTTPQQVKDFFAQGKPTIIMQGAKWCSGCTQTYPHFVEAEKVFKGKVLFGYMDTDKIALKTAKRSRYIPTFVVGKTEAELRSAVSLDKFITRDTLGFIEYVTRFTGVYP